MSSARCLGRFAVVLAAVAPPSLGSVGRPPDAGAPPRRPVALALTDGGKTLLVANRGGSVSVLDTAQARVTSEVGVGRRLADLAAAPGGRLLAVDEDANELLVLSPTLDVLHRVSVPPAPVSVCLAGDGARCTVASLWGRRLSVIDLAGERPRLARSVTLSFAPRRQLPLGDGKLLVADAFGGHLAVVDVGKGTVDSAREVPGNNINGLARAANGKDVLISQQVLSRLAQTTRDDIHWGNLLANYLRQVSVADLLRPDADLVAGSRLLGLGEFGHGTGDPAAVAVTADRTYAVALGGVDEVAISEERDGNHRYVPVGRRPTALVPSPDGRRAYVANTFGDSVSVLDVVGRKELARVALGPARAPTAAERGEVLFHDARLSHDGWLSCHSCHTDGHANGQLADTLGDGTFGAPKRVLTLRGVKDTGPWAWNGGARGLDEQVRKSVETTMRGRALTDGQVSDLVAYLGSLAPPPAEEGDGEAARRGRAVFGQRGCANCHAPPSYTSPKVYDVGLRDEAGGREFNPPSLRGVAQGGPYFHDGRAATLEEVFAKYRHQLKTELSRDDLRDLTSFLRSL